MFLHWWRLFIRFVKFFRLTSIRFGVLQLSDNMSEPSALQVVEEWSKILYKMKELGDNIDTRTKNTQLVPVRVGVSRYEVTCIEFQLKEWSEIQEEKDEAGIFIHNEVWPLFTQVDIQSYGKRLKKSYPWLHEFENTSDQDFPEVFQHFEEDPTSLLQILLAYSTLVDCEAVKRTLVFRLRDRESAMIRQFRSARKAKALEEFEGGNEDQKFLQKCMNHDVFSIYDCYFHMLNCHGFRNDIEWRKVTGRIRQFLYLVRPSKSTT